MKRSLVLRREDLAVLSGDDLAAVVGGEWSGNPQSCAHCLVYERLPSKLDCPTWICP